MILRRFFAVLILPLALQGQEADRVKSLKITVLTTMLADRIGIGEWGFAALVEADGRRILFDTGARPGTLLTNAKELGIDLSNIQDVILSHNHGDHTGGLLSVKSQIAGARIHAGKGVFYSRPYQSKETNHLVTIKPQLDGVKIFEHDKPVKLAPGVWLTGPVPRKFPERNHGTGKMITPTGEQEDTIPEDTSLVFNTDRGLVVLSGCGHAGIANVLDYARTVVRTAPVHSVIGGWHLFQLDDAKLDWTAQKLREYGVENFLGAHCTGLHAVYRIREINKMSRDKCVVGAVGSTYDLTKGIDAGLLAR